MSMNDEELLRYARQIMLPQFGIEAQEKFKAARVLIIGVGGLGSPACMYLAAAGVGSLTLVDDDVVELTNLQRQIVHHTDQLGRPKVESAKATLGMLNPLVQVNTVAHRLDHAELRDHAHRADLVLDCTDSFTSRFAINAACFETGTPLVSGAALGMQGQLAVFDARRPDSPCYRCLYDESGDDDDLSCAENGVLSPVVGVIGTLQAIETLKILANSGESLCGRLLVFDALHMDWRNLNLPRDPACPVCGQKDPV